MRGKKVNIPENFLKLHVFRQLGFIKSLYFRSWVNCGN
jgi:hypothetical protein